ncbi:MAG: hypothetical protein WC243_04745 [Patescibacteria group bacterium]|jgi:hypothetical protein
MNTDLLLIIVISLLTMNLLLVGVFVALLLKDMRKLLQKSGLILDDVHAVTGIASKPVGILLSIMSGLMEGVKVVNSVRNERRSSKERKEDE